MLTELTGLKCRGVEKGEFNWSFAFGEECSLSVECPWRLVTDGQIVLAVGDHKQQYGSTEFIDVSQVASSILSEKLIVWANSSEVGDLTVLFENETRLEVFNDSSGYEAWVMSFRDKVVVGRNG